MLNHVACHSKPLAAQTNVTQSRKQGSRLFLLTAIRAPNKVWETFWLQHTPLTWCTVDTGDQMINLAKTLQNNAYTINLAQIFVQQPRNSPDSLAVPYCQKAPQNVELNGLFPCQFQGVTQSTFAGNLAVGSPGTTPFGLTTAVDPAGSWYVFCVSLLVVN